MTPVLGNYTANQITNATSSSFAHVNNMNMVMVRVALSNPSNNLPSTFVATYGGVTIPELNEHWIFSGGTAIMLVYFLLPGALNGSNTLSISWTNAAYGVVSIVSMSYALNRTPIVADFGATPITITVPTVAADLVLEAMLLAMLGGTFSATGGQTEESHLMGSADNGVSYKQATTTSTTISYSYTAGGFGTEMAVAFYDPPAAGGVGITPVMAF